MLGIFNLVITALVLLIRLFTGPSGALESPLWAIPLLTLGLGLLLIYKSTNHIAKGKATLRVRLVLFVGSVLYITVKYQPLAAEKILWLHSTACVLLLAGLGWYFLRWWSNKTVAI